MYAPAFTRISLSAAHSREGFISFSEYRLNFPKDS
jgi:hypothetical protein